MDDVILNLDNGKKFHFKMINNSDKNKYIQSVTINGQPYTKSYLLYNDIMSGGEIDITMGPEPSKTWGVNKNSWPYSGMSKN